MSTRRSVVLASVGAAAGMILPSRAEAATTSPYSSGSLGPWTSYSHTASTAQVDRAVAADGRGVRLVGDSIAHLTASALRSALAARSRPMSWDVWGGRPTAPLADLLTRSASRGELPSTLLVVSGSNDIFDPVPFPRHLARVLDAAGPRRRVVWVSPHVARKGSPTADVRNSALVCLALERAAASHENLTVVPWFDLLAAKPAYRIPAYTPDGVHPTSTAGRAAFTALIGQRL